MNYFEHLRRRITFPVMQAQCAKYSLPTAQGWDKLSEKLVEEGKVSAQRTLEIENALAEIFKNTISVGDRAVRIFKLENRAASGLANYFLTCKPEVSEYTTTYPAPLAESKLAQLDSVPKLCEISKCTQTNAVTLIFCNRRIIEERDPRTKDQMSGELLNRFGWESYDEFILVRKKYVQSYEVVHIDIKADLVELRVEDHTGLDSSYGLDKLQEKANELIAHKYGNTLQLIKCVNLFPAIKDMYDDQNEGIVIELGFTTETGSAKNERMRRSDLRQELFHVGGKAAVNGIITPFRLAVRWQKNHDRPQEDVLLPGSIRQLGSATPFLDHMLLSGSSNELHMRDTIRRVVRHLENE